MEGRAFVVRGTEVVCVDPDTPDTAVVRRAAAIIRAGGLVAFPTETVYGLGADGLCGAAVERIFVAKGRPQDNPLILHIARPEDIRRVASEVPPAARKLVAAFWPGPLTLVLPKRPQVPDVVSAGLPTVGVRMPDDTIALTLIAEARVPVAAPSANVSGRPSPTSADHVIADLAGRIDLILDGGLTPIGVESTVVDLMCSPPKVLRPGGITLEQLKEVLGTVAVASSEPAGASSGPVLSPGMKYSHYAPKTPVILVEGGPEAVVWRILEEIRSCHEKCRRAGVMCSSETRELYSGHADVVRPVGSRGDLSAVAAALFRTLRAFDKDALDLVYAEGFDEAGLGFAVMNRLRRAAGGRVLRV